MQLRLRNADRQSAQYLLRKAQDSLRALKQFNLEKCGRTFGMLDQMLDLPGQFLHDPCHDRGLKLGLSFEPTIKRNRFAIRSNKCVQVVDGYFLSGDRHLVEH
jgi:hypothetical protein